MAAVEICLASDSPIDLRQQVDKICQAGAARIELCAQMDQAGLTPQPHAIAIARAVSKNCVELLVMVRPRSGDFQYSQSEVRQMCEQIRSAADNGANGIVIGAINAQGSDFDRPNMEELIVLAEQLGLTVGIHRAFDVITDRKAALKQLKEWQVKRVLTSGGKWGGNSKATDNQHALAELITFADDAVEVVIAGGINVSQIRQLNTTFAQTQGRYSYHAYSSVLSTSSATTNVIEPQKVRALVEAAT